MIKPETIITNVKQSTKKTNKNFTGLTMATEMPISNNSRKKRKTERKAEGRKRNGD